MVWQELGISGATALAVLIALYFVVRGAVKNGVAAALREWNYTKENGDKTENPTNTPD